MTRVEYILQQQQNYFLIQNKLCVLATLIELIEANYVPFHL